MNLHLQEEDLFLYYSIVQKIDATMTESLDIIGPLTAVLVDPDNSEHAKQLVLQRIKGGVSHPQTPHP